MEPKKIAKVVSELGTIHGYVYYDRELGNVTGFYYYFVPKGEYRKCFERLEDIDGYLQKDKYHSHFKSRLVFYKSYNRLGGLK